MNNRVGGGGGELPGVISLNGFITIESHSQALPFYTVQPSFIAVQKGHSNDGTCPFFTVALQKGH